jgi:hypothetical protein
LCDGEPGAELFEDGTLILVVAVVVVGSPLRQRALGGGEQAVGVFGLGMSEHDQPAEVRFAYVVEIAGVDADLLGPPDELLVDRVAECRVVAQRRWAVELRSWAGSGRGGRVRARQRKPQVSGGAESGRTA